jgi:hypothetical protein
VESTSRRADTRNGAGPKDRDSLIIAGSYHEQTNGIADAYAARRFAEGGFTAVSIGDGNATAVAHALNWGAAYGFTVFLDSNGPHSNSSDPLVSWGCHTSFGGMWLSEKEFAATVTRLRQGAPWLLPIVNGVTSTNAALDLAAQGVPLAAVTVPLTSHDTPAATAAKSLQILNGIRTAIALNASAQATVGVAIPVCTTNSDSLLRFAAYASLPLAFIPRTAGQGLIGALIWEGLGQCATIGSPKFDLVARINNRITQQAWIYAFANASSGVMRVWSTASFAVENSVAPGSIAGGLIDAMDDELLVFEFNANRTGTKLNGTIFVVSSQLSIKPGGAPRRAVTIRLRGATCQYRNTTKAAPSQFCKSCPGWQGEVPTSCTGGVASTQPVEGSCFQNEPTAESCGLHRVGNLLPLVLPGGSAQLVNYVGDACHDDDPARRCPKSLKSDDTTIASDAVLSRRPAFPRDDAANSEASPKTDDDACPEINGVVDASRCLGGFNAQDSTLALRAALNQSVTGAHTVVIPNVDNKPWIIAPIPGADPICPADATKWGHCPALHLVGLSNLTIILEAGVVLLAKRGQFHNPASSMVRVEHCTNITIKGETGATIRMWREDYKLPTSYIHSESRGGIAVYDSSVVKIVGMTVMYTGGDGIYLENVNNTVVRHCNCTHNFRQGMSVASATNLVVEDSSFTDTNGTAPACGVDLEPDWAFYHLNNITFRRCLFARNANCGFVINPYAITSGFAGWDPAHLLGSNTNQSISVTLDQCAFVDNIRDPKMVAAGQGSVMFELSPGPLEGVFRISDSLISGGGGPGLLLVDTSAAIRVELSNVSLINTSQAGPLGPPNFNAPIVLNAGPVRSY